MSLERLKADPRTAWVILGLMMVASLLFALWAADGVYFTDDELYWLGSSPNTTFERAFDPHSGHLIAVSRLLYRGIFETIGTAYLPFRLLSLGVGRSWAEDADIFDIMVFLPPARCRLEGPDPIRVHLEVDDHITPHDLG